MKMQKILKNIIENYLTIEAQNVTSHSQFSSRNIVKLNRFSYNLCQIWVLLSKILLFIILNLEIFTYLLRILKDTISSQMAPFTIV